MNLPLKRSGANIPLIYLLCFLMLALYLPRAAHAHEIFTSGPATWELHIGPGHVAVAGKPVILDMVLESAGGGFSVNKCTCVLTITHDGKTLLSTALVPAKAGREFNVEAVPFTFPTDGAYQLHLSATPITSGFFTPFAIDDHEQVLPVGSVPPPDDSTSAASHAGHTQTHAVIYFIEAAIFTAVMGYFLFSNKKPQFRFPFKKSVARIR